MGRKKIKRKTRIEEILEEKGKDVKWLADELKRKFKINKKDTIARVKGELSYSINERIMMAIVLKISLKDF